MIDARLFVFAAALLASPALGQEVDGVIATGSSIAAPMSTDQKIANILAAARADDIARKTFEGVPRRTQGEAGVAVGSDGYRSAYVQAVIPVGETGAVGLAYSQSQGGRGYGYGTGFGGPGYGPGYDGPGYDDLSHDGYRRGYERRPGRSLGLAFDVDTSKSTSADDCRATFREGRQPVEPMWATQKRGRSACGGKKD